MYRIYREVLHSDEGDFRILVKSGVFQKKVYGSFQGDSLKIREVSHVCSGICDVI